MYLEISGPLAFAIIAGLFNSLLIEAFDKDPISFATEYLDFLKADKGIIQDYAKNANECIITIINQEILKRFGNTSMPEIARKVRAFLNTDTEFPYTIARSLRNYNFEELAKMFRLSITNLEIEDDIKKLGEEKIADCFKCEEYDEESLLRITILSAKKKEKFYLIYTMEELNKIYEEPGVTSSPKKRDKKKPLPDNKAKERPKLKLGCGHSNVIDLYKEYTMKLKSLYPNAPLVLKCQAKTSCFYLLKEEESKKILGDYYMKFYNVDNVIHFF